MPDDRDLCLRGFLPSHNAAQRPDMAAGDVLAVAILWEAWVIEPAD